ncbi:MAG: HlyD family efflux transporter periplasmic adaptor subunit [Clostridia bacterium]|nr:HlyD family efflux transporter periplasmic adaptor subunit [Clostridia bacterium]
MSKDSESRRAWIKNVMIIFLVVLLLLTFFSNTILNYTLPEVSAQYAQYGSITSSVKVNGTVKANESYNVMYEADQAEAEGGTIQSRKVVSVYVKEGDTVSTDSPIIALQGGASDQLKAAQDEYDKLKRTYDLALLQDTVNGLQSSKTLNDAVQAIADQKKTLAELKEEYAAVMNGADTTSVIEARIEMLEEEIEDLTDLISAQSSKIAEIEGKIQSAEGMIEEDIFSTLTVSEKLAIAEEEYTAIEQSYNTLSADVENLKSELERIQGSSGDIEKANALTKEIRTLEDQLYNLEKQYDRAEEDYYDDVSAIVESYGKAFDAAQKALDDYLDALENAEQETPDASEEELPIYDGYPDPQEEALREALEEASDNYDRALRGEVDEIESLRKSYERSQEDLEEQIDTIERQISDAREKLDVVGLPEVDDVVDYATGYDLAEAQRKYEEASAELTEVKSKYEETKTKVESLRKQNTASGTVSEYTLLLQTYESDLDSLEAQLKQKNKDLEAKRKELGKIETPADPDEILKQIETAESTIKDLEAQLEITKATETQSDKTTEFERADQLKQLAELEAKIEEYKNAPETTNVNAPIAGRIVSIDVVPGDTVTSGQTVARIEIADKGYICEISMAAEEARKIQVGAECSISNSWWYSEISASVTQIRSDPQSQGKNRIVVITVNGDVYEGQNLSFTIGDRNQSYDCVLPNSAIREDNDGKFVLTVTSKKTPLGVRYTAVRTNIEVIASDDTNSAVSGLYGSEFVITNATSPISDKQQVRLAEG